MSAASALPSLQFVRLIFDRGTLVFDGAPFGSDVHALPGVLWDERVRVYRAPAFRYRDIASVIATKAIRDDVWPSAPAPGGWGPIGLRPYQDAALAAWELSGRQGLVVLPTGAGKTHVALAVLARTRARALILVPTRALMEQWMDSIGRFYSSSVGCLGDGVRDEQPITVATFESAYRAAARLGNRFDLLVVDEAHHFGRGLRDEILEMAIAPHRLGLTATPPDDPIQIQRLTQLVGPVVHALCVADLAGRYLAPFREVRISVDLNREERLRHDTAMADFRPVMAEFRRLAPNAPWADFMRFAGQTAVGRRALSGLREARSISEFNQAKRRLVGAIVARHPRSRILVFTGDNAAAYALSTDHLIMPITCDIGRAERKEVLSRFADGELRCLVSARVLNEGIDIPEADVAVIVAGAHGQREHVQRVGRVLRPSPGKHAVLYELVTSRTSETRRANTRSHGLATPIATAI